MILSFLSEVSAHYLWQNLPEAIRILHFSIMSRSTIYDLWERRYMWFGWPNTISLFFVGIRESQRLDSPFKLVIQDVTISETLFYSIGMWRQWDPPSSICCRNWTWRRGEFRKKSENVFYFEHPSFQNCYNKNGPGLGLGLWVGKTKKYLFKFLFLQIIDHLSKSCYSLSW